MAYEFNFPVASGTVYVIESLNIFDKPVCIAQCNYFGAAWAVVQELKNNNIPYKVRWGNNGDLHETLNN